MPEKKASCVIGLVVAVIILATAIILPLSFATLEYYEFGFLRGRSTGSVDTTKVYSNGRYFKGPTVELKPFRADAHFVSLKDIDVFTFDKLEVELTVHFQYFLRKDELQLIHGKFDIYYDDIMKASAEDALKGAVVVFTTRDLTENRTSVEQVLYKAVRERLGGVCCRPNCDDYVQACPEGCLPQESCTDKDKGLNVDVKFFQLAGAIIPEEVQGRRLQALILNEEALRATLIQESEVVRKETSALVAQIENEAIEIKQTAVTKGNQIVRIANANYTTFIEQARVQGLSEVFSFLNFTSERYKTSFDYLRTIRGSNKARFTVNFQQRIAGTL